MRTVPLSLVLALGLAATPALAQRRGEGSGRSPDTAPATKSAGPPEEQALRTPTDLPVLPPHGMLGAPGAAQDALGPSRLGAHADSPTAPSYGESARLGATGEVYQGWKSGDRVRSLNSGDVRAARQEQAPDLEWANTGGAAKPQLEPQTPYGVQVQQPKAQRSRTRERAPAPKPQR